MPNKLNKSKVFFNNNHVNVSLKQRNHLKKFIELLFKKEKIKLKYIHFIFCSDAFLLTINKAHLNHDYYTDIITFNLSENSIDTVGEIYISLDRVKENAKQLKQTYNTELHRVIFHGCLHLCGYRDKSNTDIKLMRKMEDLYLKKYFP